MILTKINDVFSLFIEYSEIIQETRNTILQVLHQDTKITSIEKLYETIYNIKTIFEKYYSSKDSAFNKVIGLQMCIDKSFINLLPDLNAFLSENNELVKNVSFEEFIKTINFYNGFSLNNFIKVFGDFINYLYYIDTFIVNLIEYQKDIYLHVNKFTEEKISNYKNKKDIFLIDYLYMLANNNNECVDIFFEKSHKNIVSFTNSLEDLKRLRLLNLCENVFIPCNYYYDKCSEFFNSLRLHSSNYRIYSAFLNTYEKEEIIKNFLKRVEDKVKFLNDFIDYVVDEKIVNDENSFVKYYLSPIRDLHAKTNFFNVDMYLEKIFKQYKKSIFYTENKFLLKNVICKLMIIITHKSNDLYSDTEVLIFNLYNIFRMFVMKAMWDETKINRKNLTTKCKTLSYPKNIVSFTGENHAQWFNYFIKIYFFLYIHA